MEGETVVVIGLLALSAFIWFIIFILALLYV